MKKQITTLMMGLLLSATASAQTFSWTTNDSIVTNLTPDSYTAHPMHQVAVGQGTVTLAVEVLYNDIPATWDGMLCIYGTCLGTFPVVGTQATMSPISGTIEGMTRLTVNPGTGTEVAKFQLYVYDVNHPNDGDTATWIFNSTLGMDDVLAESFTVYPNPAKDVLKVSMKQAVQSISIMDLNGRVLSETTPSSLESEINVAALPSGSYFVILEDNAGNRAQKLFTKE